MFMTLNFGIWSLIGLVIAILIGSMRKVNTGIVSIGMAFLIGYFIVGLSGSEIIGGWPTQLFFILLGMSSLFSIVRANGTLNVMVERCVHVVRGKTRLLPILFFLISAILAAIGPGNIAVCAIMLPMGLAIAQSERISPLLISLMVITGANGGGVSPIAPTGIIGTGLGEREGMDIAWQLFRDNGLVSLVAGILTYITLGGWKISPRKEGNVSSIKSFTSKQLLTFMTVCLVVLAIIGGGWNIGLTGFLGTAVLLIMRTVEEKKYIESIPWSALILVCGVAVMVNVVEVSGGIEVLTDVLKAIMNERTVGPILAVLSGLMSLVSSASGVVMPTLIPMVNGIASGLEGIRPESLVSIIVVGSHLVSLSPLSTLGALAIAVVEGEDQHKLFFQLLIAGFVFLVLGGVLSYFIVLI